MPGPRDNQGQGRRVRVCEHLPEIAKNSRPSRDRRQERSPWPVLPVAAQILDHKSRRSLRGFASTPDRSTAPRGGHQGILTFSRISAAFSGRCHGCTGARSDALVGRIFTPAIRATDFLSCRDPCWGGCFLLSRAGVHKREHDALALGCPGGPASFENYPTGYASY